MKEVIYTVDIGPYATYWYVNGKLHRANGPAVEHFNGDKEWYLSGKVHRANGPAVEFNSFNHKYWYFNGKHYDPNHRIFKISSNSNCFRYQ